MWSSTQLVEKFRHLQDMFHIGGTHASMMAKT